LLIAPVSVSRPHDKFVRATRECYGRNSKSSNLIENIFCKLKELERIAMLSDKTDRSFSAMIHLVAALIHSR
jgi:hypothetical protein